MFQVNPLHMKDQALFSTKDKSKKIKCRLLQFLFGALRVNIYERQDKYVKISGASFKVKGYACREATLPFLSPFSMTVNTENEESTLL